MLFPLNRIELCTASKSDKRAQLRYVHLDARGRRLLATDGHIAAVLPVDPDAGDISGPIPLGCIRDARKQDSRISLNCVAILTDGAAYERPHAPLTADIDRVIPAPGGQAIALDAELLYRLAQCLSGGKTRSYIRIYIPTDRFSAIRVEPLNGAGYGVIMTCRDPKAS